MYRKYEDLTPDIDKFDLDLHEEVISTYMEYYRKCNAASNRCSAIYTWYLDMWNDETTKLMMSFHHMSANMLHLAKYLDNDNGYAFKIDGQLLTKFQWESLINKSEWYSAKYKEDYNKLFDAIPRNRPEQHHETKAHRIYIFKKMYKCFMFWNSIKNNTEFWDVGQLQRYITNVDNCLAYSSERKMTDSERFDGQNTLSYFFSQPTPNYSYLNDRAEFERLEKKSKKRIPTWSETHDAKREPAKFEDYKRRYGYEP